MGTELFPDANAPLLRIRLRAPAGTRIEETERIVMHALDVIQREAGPDNVRITSDFRGPDPVQLPRGPDPPVHQRAAGGHHPGGAAARTPRAAKRFARGCATSLHRELPGTQVSFEAADIVTQVMSFGSPTPVEIAVQGVSLQNDYAYAQKVQAQLAKLSFLRDLAIRAGEQLSHARYQHRPRAQPASSD